MTPGKHGFTLVELLTAVAIVAILAAIVLPALVQVRLSGLATRSIANLHDLAAANDAYANDHDGFYCPAWNSLNTILWCGAKVGTTFDPTKGYLAPYLGNVGQVKLCPLFHPTVTGAQSFDSGTGGYGYNEVYIGGTPDAPFQPARRANIARPAQTVMFTTTALAVGAGVQEYPFCEPPFWVDSSGNPDGGRPTPSVDFRYRGQALVAWCDGHVSAETMQARGDGYNPYGGDAAAQHLGWFGPDDRNGFWNPMR